LISIAVIAIALTEKAAVIRVCVQNLHSNRQDYGSVDSSSAKKESSSILHVGIVKLGLNKVEESTKSQSQINEYQC